METNKNLTHPKYRSDIDGLRAIAVLSVVIYHAFPNFLKGGFIGVDIFFVISGFLISTIIFENLNNSSFSFATFYSRRIRRIFPALITVLITAVIFGYYVLFSDEFKQLGRHIIGGATFSSNFTLLKESGYFDTASEFKPLLHLWSLGIEEQFYIIFPLVCYFLYKYNVRLLLFIIPLTIISYYLNIKGIKTDITKTFYYPHTRFWELLFGSLLAYFTINKCQFINSIGNFLDTIIFSNKENSNSNNNNSKHRLLNLLSILGFLLLVYGLIRINSALKFPGKWALVPVIGSVLIILSGKESIINKFILGNKILVWFGKISFPLYLWHWVLLAYARIIYGEIPPQSWRISLVIAAIILSYLTYKFIESPLRFGGNNKKKVIFLCLMMIIIGGFGYSIHNEKIKVNNNLPNVVSGYEPECKKQWGILGIEPETNPWNKGGLCKLGNRDADKKILVFGDSRAFDLTRQINEQFKKNYSIDIIVSPVCYMGANIIINNGEHCKNNINILKNYLKENSFIDIIITSQQEFLFSNNSNFIHDKLMLIKDSKYNHFFIVENAVIPNSYNCQISNMRQKYFNIKCPNDNIQPINNFYNLSKEIKVDKLYFIYSMKTLCKYEKLCKLLNTKRQLNFMDFAHLSYYGSEPVVNEIAKIIESK